MVEFIQNICFEYETNISDQPSTNIGPPSKIIGLCDMVRAKENHVTDTYKHMYGTLRDPGSSDDILTRSNYLISRCDDIIRRGNELSNKISMSLPKFRTYDLKQINQDLVNCCQNLTDLRLFTVNNGNIVLFTVVRWLSLPFVILYQVIGSVAT